jgi:hypothetical protein
VLRLVLENLREVTRTDPAYLHNLVMLVTPVGMTSGAA